MCTSYVVANHSSQVRGRALRDILDRMAGITVAPPKEREKIGGGSTLGDVSRIVVLNDNHNSFEGVAFALSRVLPGVNYDKGMTLANSIHSSGQAIVWSGQREQAELYWEQLNESGLTLAPLEG
jgi:ATP-dependent Clp protease adaptor protein ClpS